MLAMACMAFFAAAASAQTRCLNAIISIGTMPDMVDGKSLSEAAGMAGNRRDFFVAGASGKNHRQYSQFSSG
jgi:hypothetical protein